MNAAPTKGRDADGEVERATDPLSPLGAGPRTRPTSTASTRLGRLPVQGEHMAALAGGSAPPADRHRRSLRKADPIAARSSGEASPETPSPRARSGQGPRRLPCTLAPAGSSSSAPPLVEPLRTRPPGPAGRPPFPTSGHSARMLEQSVVSAAISPAAVRRDYRDPERDSVPGRLLQAADRVGRTRQVAKAGRGPGRRSSRSWIARPRGRPPPVRGTGLPKRCRRRGSPTTPRIETSSRGMT